MVSRLRSTRWCRVPTGTRVGKVGVRRMCKPMAWFSGITCHTLEPLYKIALPPQPSSSQMKWNQLSTPQKISPYYDHRWEFPHHSSRYGIDRTLPLVCSVSFRSIEGLGIRPLFSLTLQCLLQYLYSYYSY